jgi:DNA-binding GntR family transcriptional regulator
MVTSEAEVAVAERDARQGISRPGSVVDGVYDIIYHRLMSLEIAPGARILIGYSAAPQWTRKQFEDLYAFRLLLEPEGARLAAINMTPEALRELETGAADMGSGEPPVDRNTRYSRFARADAKFHDDIMRISGNEIIRSTLFNQHVHLHIFRLMFHTRVTQEALEEHDALLAAFRNRDPQTAYQAMYVHIERSRDRLLSAFE